MTKPMLNVLFLSTGNAIRSILAESILQYWGENNFFAFSAGTHPKESIHPYVPDILKRLDFPYENLHPKDLNQILDNNSNSIDLVITLCDRDSEEECPVWPGEAITIHWNMRKLDTQMDEKDQLSQVRKLFSELENRIKILVSVPLDKLEDISLNEQLKQLD